MTTTRLLLVLSACGLAPLLHAGAIYSSNNLIYAGNAGHTSIMSGGPSSSPVILNDSYTLDGWGTGSYSSTAADNQLTISAAAHANGIVGDGFGTTGVAGVNFDLQLFDSLIFNSTDGNPVAVRFTLNLLDDFYSSSWGDAKAQVNASFDPAGNTSYFNTGLNDYDTVGTGFGPSTVNASGIYYIPDGAVVNFRLALSGQIAASFGYDFVHDQPFATDVRLNASSTALGLEILSPGGSYTSGSGAHYDTPAPVGVPESANVGALLGLGLGALGFVHRRRLGR